MEDDFDSIPLEQLLTSIPRTRWDQLFDRIKSRFDDPDTPMIDDAWLENKRREKLARRGIRETPDSVTYDPDSDERIGGDAEGALDRSSNVSSIAYHWKRGRLTIVFDKKGSRRWGGILRTYHYDLDDETGRRVFDTIYTAPSPGHEVWVHIRWAGIQPTEGPV